MVKGFLKNSLILIIILAVVYVILALPEMLRHDQPEKMPGQENTYRVVTLYNSLYPDAGKMLGEIMDLERMYEDVPEFVYVDTSDEDEETGNLKLMAGRNYTVYFLDKNNEIKTLWYDAQFEKDAFIEVISQYFGVEPKD